MRKDIGLFATLLILLGLIIFGKFDREKKSELIKQQQEQLEVLKKELKKQQEATVVLQKEADSLLKLWKSTSKEVIINKIQVKNETKRNTIRNATDDELLRIFTGILQEEK